MPPKKRTTKKTNPPTTALPAPKKIVEYTVIRDKREKPGHGWMFEEHRNCLGTSVQHLKTGDYTLIGYEDLLCIERKGSVKEFVSNLYQKRFTNELERMKDFKYPVVILEFELEDLTRWPASAGMQTWRLPSYMKIPGSALARFWKLWMAHQHVQFIFSIAGEISRDPV